MRISNIFSINNSIYKNPFLQNKQEKCDTTNFRGIDTPIKKVATVSKKSQGSIENITKNIGKIQEIFGGLSEKYGPQKIADLKKQYEKFIPKKGRGLTFKLGNWYMTINLLSEHQEILKIYTRKENDRDPHLFFIEQDGRVYAKANPKNPKRFPLSQELMDEKTVEESRVEDQIAVADREISKFLECMLDSDKEHVDGTLGSESQAEIQKINSEWVLIEQIKEKAKIRGRKWYKQKITDSMQDFEGFVPQKKEGISFECENGILQIGKTKQDEDLIKLTLKDANNEILELFYIAEGDKVLSNVSKEYPAMLPATYKYMSEEQIKELGIDKYISFASQKLGELREHLETGLIDKKPADAPTVSEEAQGAIENIIKNYTELNEIFASFKEKHNNHSETLARLKQKYERYVPAAGSGKTLTFKIDGWQMSLSQLEEHSGVLKIYTRKKDGSEPHLFLIEQDGRVYANAPVNNVRHFPSTAKYMNEEQIIDSRVEEQIAVANEEITNFLECMRNATKEHTDGVLGPQLQAQVHSISENWDLVEQIEAQAEKRGWSRRKINSKRRDYSEYAPRNGVGISFKYNDDIIQISRPPENKNILRLNIRNYYDEIKQVFCIVDNSKILSNININYPTQMPNTYKFMDEEKIKASEVEKYIEFASEKMGEFKKFLNEELEKEPQQKEDKPPKVKPPKVKTPKEPKRKSERSVGVNYGQIYTPVRKRGDLLPEFEGSKRREFPKELKLSEIDELFEEITGKTIGQVAGGGTSAPIPEPAAFRRSVVIRVDGEPMRPIVPKTKAKKEVPVEPKPQKAEPVKEVKQAPTPKAVERTIWGLTNYVEENNSFQIETPNGSTISVAKLELEDLEYLSIIKATPSGRKTYFNIDCDNEKLLKTDLSGQPMLKDGDFIPYSDVDLRVLKFQDSLDITLEEIFNSLEDDGVKTKALEPKIRLLQSGEDEPQEISPTRVEAVVQDVAKEEMSPDMEEMKKQARNKAKFDAKEIANEYFLTFVAEFKSEMAKKMEEFEKIKKQFFEKKK